jgi:uncharacterized membrane protein
MFAIGRFFRWLFIDPVIFALSASYIVVVLFTYSCQRFFSPYTSDSNPRAKELFKEVEKRLDDMKPKTTNLPTA